MRGFKYISEGCCWYLKDFAKWGLSKAIQQNVIGMERFKDVHLPLIGYQK